MKIFITLLLFTLILISCSSDNSELQELNLENQELSLRNKLGLSNSKLSDKIKNDIKKNTHPIYFNSIDEAKEFIKVSKNLFFSKTENNTQPINKTIGPNNELTNKITQNPGDQFKSICEEGRGVVSTGNLSIHTFINLRFNYSRPIIFLPHVASNFNSYMSGLTLGVSFEQINASQTAPHNYTTISVRLEGVMNYNIFVEGIGTIWRDPVNFIGKYTPCTKIGYLTSE